MNDPDFEAKSVIPYFENLMTYKKWHNGSDDKDIKVENKSQISNEDTNSSSENVNSPKELIEKSNEIEL